MPPVGGLEVLNWRRNHPQFRTIPTLVFTSSRAASDVAAAYGLGANAYMVKPTAFNDFEKLGRLVVDYWEACEMPKGPGQNQ